MYWLIVGWLAWVISAYLAITFTIGSYLYIKKGSGVQTATIIQTIFWWILAITFLLIKINKLHLLWLLPAALFYAPLISNRRVGKNE